MARASDKHRSCEVFIVVYLVEIIMDMIMIRQIIYKRIQGLDKIVTE